MLAYLDAGSGAALATVIASGAVGASALLGNTRRRLAEKLGRARQVPDPSAPEDDVDGDIDRPANH